MVIRSTTCNAMLQCNTMQCCGFCCSKNYYENYNGNFNIFFHFPVGVGYDVVQRDLDDEVKKSGLHNGPPGFKFIKFPSVFKSKSFDNVKCLNKEGLEINLKIEFQYRARPKDLRKTILQFKDFENYVKVLE